MDSYLPVFASARPGTTGSAPRSILLLKKRPQVPPPVKRLADTQPGMQSWQSRGLARKGRPGRRSHRNLAGRKIVRPVADEANQCTADAGATVALPPASPNVRPESDAKAPNPSEGKPKIGRGRGASSMRGSSEAAMTSQPLSLPPPSQEASSEVEASEEGCKAPVTPTRPEPWRTGRSPVPAVVTPMKTEAFAAEKGSMVDSGSKTPEGDPEEAAPSENNFSLAHMRHLPMSRRVSPRASPRPSAATARPSMQPQLQQQQSPPQPSPLGGDSPLEHLPALATPESEPSEREVPSGATTPPRPCLPVVEVRPADAAGVPSPPVRSSLNETKPTLRSTCKERLAKTREGAKARFWKERLAIEEETRWRMFHRLPAAESKTLEQCFKRYDIDNSGKLEGTEILEALREMGLRGYDLYQKKEIFRICREAAVEHDALCRPSRRRRSVAPSRVELDGPSGGGVRTPSPNGKDCAVDFLTFALKVVPRVRARLAEVQSHVLLRQFNLFDKDGSGRISLADCLDLAPILGLDQRVLGEEFRLRGLEGDDDLNSADFQDIVIRAREKLERVVKMRERAIQDEFSIDEFTFQEIRQDVVNMYDIFCRYRCHQGKLGRDFVMPVLREFGLLPKLQREREWLRGLIYNLGSDEEDYSLSFLELVELAQEIRAYNQENQRASLKTRFERYDRNHTGYLSVSEISALLMDVGVLTRNRREQEELGQLISAVDEDGNGVVDFEEFQVLSQRIEEKLKAMRYEEEVEHAMVLGFTQLQLRDLRWVFDSLDVDGSQRLSAQEVRAGLAKMDKKVSQHAFEAAFAGLDSDGSGELDFLEFLEFMQLLRDGEGVFGEETQKLTTRAKFLETQLLRRLLENFRLTRMYLYSLTQPELVDLFCTQFDIDPNANLPQELGITSVGELLKLAKEKAIRAPGVF
eukprot:TRINITY_DN22985_c0_g1_i1.p1 TRINITY_DN22985_c0_g1~~TRINITY_DN22985_c0_g1_i1.p1  ORF type:complete len:1051 (+),score=255.24 TRINITY_DN22985_c0_g1_i1:389-3154(+)